MNLKSIPALLAALVSLSALAADYTDTARVISSTPIYEKVVEPRQECWTETGNVSAQAAPERGLLAPIVGGAAGALLGSQVGRGRGRDAAAATGAVVGAVAGDRVANPNSPNSTTGTVIGGVAGAILGNQVGSGAGRTAATAAGAIAGAMVGDRVASHGAPSSQPAQIQRCRTIETTRDVFKGYRVTYRYSGRDIVTTLPYDPGPTVKINVGVIGSGPDTPAQPHDPPAVSSTDTSHDSSGTHSGAYPGAWSGGGGHHH